MVINALIERSFNKNVYQKAKHFVTQGFSKSCTKANCSLRTHFLRLQESVASLFGYEESQLLLLYPEAMFSQRDVRRNYDGVLLMFV